jgi:hypothetical protein
MKKMMIPRIALLVCMGHAAAYGGETRQKLAVCLDVETADPHLITPLAQYLATRIFAKVGISLDWRACARAGESWQAPIVVQLVSGTPEGFMPGVLGYAMPYRGQITVFFDRIATMQDPRIVLGHVMVHEITHVIQGVSRHSDTGLMKPHWSSGDLAEMRHKPLPFTREDLMLLYSRLATQREQAGLPALLGQFAGQGGSSHVGQDR